MGSSVWAPSSKLGDHRQISGTWTWDVQRDLIFGDVNLGDYFGLSEDEFARGVPIERCLRSIVPQDRQRVKEAINFAVYDSIPFREVYRVQSRTRGIRKILAIGRCYMDASGEPRHYPGWFLDISEPAQSGETALKFAADHINCIREVAVSAGEELIGYLLDNVLEEIRLRLD